MEVKIKFVWCDFGKPEKVFTTEFTIQVEEPLAYHDSLLFEQAMFGFLPLYGDHSPYILEATFTFPK